MQEKFEVLASRVKHCLRWYVESITEPSPDRAKDKYVCPFPDCKSGTGENGTGGFGIYDDNESWHCFSCNRGGDILDLIGEYENIPNSPEGKWKRLERAYQIAGLELEESNTKPTSKAQNNNLPSLQASYPTAPAAAQPKTKQEEPLTDYTEFFKEAHKNIANTDYHRGLSNEVLERFNIGYVEQWNHPKTPYEKPTPRLIIPTSKYTYVARYANSNIPEKVSKVKNVGKISDYPFNIQALSQEQISTNKLKPIFIVEGAIDAMSVIEAGGEAIALNGVNYKPIIKKLKELEYVPPIVVALDNEPGKTGDKEQAKFVEALQALKNDPTKRFFDFSEEVISLDKKDANEALTSNREQFIAKVVEVVDRETEVRRAKMQEAEIKEQKEKEEKLHEYKQKYNVASLLPGFLKGEGFDSTYYPTGKLPKFDKAIGGGLREGLYVLGGTTSAGKTAFTLQLADLIAQRGKDIIYFTLEIPAAQLIARSISRYSFINSYELYKYKNPYSEITDKNTTCNETAKSAQQVMEVEKMVQLTGRAKIVMDSALEEYRNLAGHVNIVEGKGNISVISKPSTDSARPGISIDEIVQEHINLTGETPIVFVDYLQILGKNDDNQTAKDNTDKAVGQLKMLSEKYHTPVFVVSSLNRANYDKGLITETAYKESGGIEYTADCLIALNTMDPNQKLAKLEAGEKGGVYSNMENFNKPQFKKANPRHIVVEILKCRHAQLGKMIEYQYYCAFDYFEEV